MDNSHTKIGTSFSKEEDVAICNSWLCITQDPIVGNSQSIPVFWKRIIENYTSCIPDSSRSGTSIESRWRVINKNVSKFCGCIASIENRHQSGTVEADVVGEAKKLYLQKVKKEFNMEHCWEILKQSVKWQTPPMESSNSQATFVDMTEFPTSSMVPATFVDITSDQATSGGSVGSPRTKRPGGNKAAKEARRKLNAAEAGSSRFCDLMEEFNKQASATDLKKTKLAERKVKALEDLNAMEQKKEDERIMSIDISGMDPQTQAYYAMRKSEILAKLMENSSCYTPLPPNFQL